MDTQPADERTRLSKDRTSLAQFRTQLSLDRTTLAWIRTALTMATFGFGTVGFFRSLRLASQTPEAIALHASAIRFGVALIVLAVAATVLSSLAHWRALRRLRRDEPPVLGRWPLSITIAMLLALIGLLLLWGMLSSFRSRVASISAQSPEAFTLAESVDVPVTNNVAVHADALSPRIPMAAHRERDQWN